MKAALIMGSDSDWEVMSPAVDVLKEFGVETEVVVASAHRTPEKVHEFAQGAAGRDIGVIIAAAGAAAHLLCAGSAPAGRRAKARLKQAVQNSPLGVFVQIKGGKSNEQVKLRAPNCVRFF